MKNNATAQVASPSSVVGILAKPKYAAIAGMIVIFALAPLYLPTYPLHVLILILLFAYWAQAWNIVGGFAGSFSFLHPLFIAAGAYTSALLFINTGITPWLGMFIGAAIAVVLSIPITFIGIRAKLPRLSQALISMAFVLIAYNISENFAFLGGGERGITIPLALGAGNFQFESKAGFYYTILIMVICIMVFCWLLLRSRLGLYFRSIADNETAAEAVGVSVMRYSIIAMAISAFFTALGGAFFAQFSQTFLPSSVISFTQIIQIILFIAVGGMGTFWGPVIGVLLLMPVGEALRAQLPQFQALHLLLYGVVVITILSLMPNGIVGFIRARNAKRAQMQKRAT